MPWLDILDRPIAFHPCFVRLVGSVNAALFLSQAIYWSRRTKDPEGWFYKSERDWESEIRLTRREQQGARKLLDKFAFWEEERRGNPARLFFRVNDELLGDAVTAMANEDRAPNVQSHAPAGAPVAPPGATPAPTGATPRARPNNRSETTTKNTTLAHALRAARVTDTRKLIQFLARQVGPIANTAAQAKAIGWLLDRGYTLEQCEQCLVSVKAEQWRTTTVSWWTVTKEIERYVKSIEVNQGHSETNRSRLRSPKSE